MAESVNETSGPSLEQILWRAMDRWAEGPALIDAGEFAEQIAHVFDGALPAEAFVDRFYSGVEKLHHAPEDVADAVVQGRHESLHVYEFDLRRLDYVVVEDDHEVLVVSDFGQFELASEDGLRRAIDAAVVRQRAETSAAPRGWLVRKSGEMVALDVKKIAASLQQFMLRQVSMPAVQQPATRLAPFQPVRRALGEEREARALRQDARARQPMPGPRAAGSARPAPDRPQPPFSTASQKGPMGGIGAATRWRDMLGGGSRSAIGAELGEARRTAIQAGKVVAIFHRDGSRPGELARIRSEALSAVRGAGAPALLLGDDGLAKAIHAGAPGAAGFPRQDRFWVQPETAFRPAPEVAAPAPVPVRLGEITGDPWADWALTGLGGLALRAALDRARQRAAMPIAPGLVARLRDRARELALSGSPIVGFRAPDGTVLPLGSSGPARFDRGDRPALPPLEPAGSPSLAPRSGAVPATALAALQLSLERTASAGGYKLPALRLRSAPDAVENGAALDLEAADPRRRDVRLARAISLGERSAQLLLSMPFPNRSEVHVGDDLAQALHAYLATPPTPAPPATPASSAIVLGLRRPVGGEAGWTELHSAAAMKAREAVLTLEAPSAQGSSSVAALPSLLRRALRNGSGWSPAAAPMPAALRDLALRGPFELAASAPPAPSRPLNAGEEEIVIPMPLWAQMGRGRLSEAHQIMASPVLGAGREPPLGEYRLVLPMGGPVDLTSGAPSGTPGTVEVAGPTSLRLLAVRGSLAAATPQGHQPVARVPVGDGATVATHRGRLPIGPPPVLAAQPASLARASAAPDAGEIPRSLAAPPGAPPGPASPFAGADSFVVGLQPGAWSGHQSQSSPGYQVWSYAPRADLPQSSSGVPPGALSRPSSPSLPTALRFRYAGAPLWWSASTQDLAGHESERSLRDGLRAASSAASLWRSILVAVASGGAADRDGGAGHEAHAAGTSSLSRRLESLAASPQVGRAAAQGSGAIAIARSGQAGPVSGPLARADSVEMSIVAAIPPRPPPLESMSSVPAGGQQPHARGKGHPAGDRGQLAHPDAPDSVSHSKIEGSVDAIAQRIYHRIRRRMQSDRERFGG